MRRIVSIAGQVRDVLEDQSPSLLDSDDTDALLAAFPKSDGLCKTELTLDDVIGRLMIRMGVHKTLGIPLIEEVTELIPRHTAHRSNISAIARHNEALEGERLGLTALKDCEVAKCENYRLLLNQPLGDERRDKIVGELEQSNIKLTEIEGKIEAMNVSIHQANIDREVAQEMADQEEGVAGE